MGEISLVYLLRYASYRILEFFRHWYVNGFLRAGDWTVGVLERLDRFFAVRINLKNIFKPLYQDYSFIGYIWGFLFRSARVLVGGFIYGLIIFIAISFYAAWAAFPVYIIVKIFPHGS